MSKLLDFVMTRAWAIEEVVLQNGMQILDRHGRGQRLPEAEIAAIVRGRDDLAALRKRPENSKGGDAGYYLIGSVAVVPVDGVICKYASMINDVSQPQGTTTDAIRESLQAAAQDPAVRSILMDFDSPGGTVTGTEETSALVAKLAGNPKPIVAYAHDRMASGAYFIGCRANSIYASPTGAVGSIGVYVVLADTSQAHEDAGVRVHLVKAGEHKGIGTDGVAITEPQLGVVQREIDAYYRVFVAAVAAGRRVPEAAVLRLADGRSHVGTDAMAAGLVDGIVGFDELVAQMDRQYGSGLAPVPGRAGGPGGHAGVRAMSTTKAAGHAGAPASYDDAVEEITNRLMAAGKSYAAARSGAFAEAADKYPQLHERWKVDGGLRRAEQRAAARGVRRSIGLVSPTDGRPAAVGGAVQMASGAGYMARVEAIKADLMRQGKSEAVATSQAFSLASDRFPDEHEQWKQEQAAASHERRMERRHQRV